MTAVVQREQSTTMASMGGFGNNIIVSHRIHRGSQTGAAASRVAADPVVAALSSAGPLLITQNPFSSSQTSTSSEQMAPAWGRQVPSVLPVDVFDGGRTDDDSLQGPSSSSSSPHSPLPGRGPSSYPGDPYSR